MPRLRWLGAFPDEARAELERHGLGGVREHARPRVLRHHGEVPEDAADVHIPEERVGARTVRALVVAVLDHERRVGIAADVVLGGECGRPGRG